MAKLLNKKKRPEWEREGFFFSSPHFPECAVTILYRLNVSSLSSPTSAHFHGGEVDVPIDGAGIVPLIQDFTHRMQEGFE
ncbi:hypothetical protein X798_01990 [Onchocerca flexuosa]|uniref:Uncharacterized protein n=1 Tax=Onchocerca flexuosa TaxID=387005 RepID=A0A238C134_9BILA|nr:hypothetical protein X798_01990 [Onchocerca flexuosa]